MTANLFVLNYYVIYWVLLWPSLLGVVGSLSWSKVVAFSFGVKRSYVVYPPEGPRPPSPEEMREMARELARKKNSSQWCSFGLQVNVVALQLNLPVPVRNQETCIIYYAECEHLQMDFQNQITWLGWLMYVHLFSVLFLAWLGRCISILVVKLTELNASSIMQWCLQIFIYSSTRKFFLFFLKG